MRKKICFLILVGVAFLATVQAEANKEILSPGEVISVVQGMDKYIPEEWGKVTPDSPYLLYHIVNNKLSPFYWIVPMRNESTLAGLVYIDPFDGHFGMRVNALYDGGIPVTPSKEVLTELLSSKGYSPENFDLLDPKLTFIGGTQQANFWIILKKNADYTESLAIKIEEARINGVKSELFLLKNIIEEINQAEIALKESASSEEYQLDSAFSLTRITTRGSPHKTTWMVEEVPFYKQDYNNCWAYATVMQHQWWSPKELGTGHDQVWEMCGHFGWDPTAGGTLDMIETAMKNWHDVNNDYENYQKVYKGEGFAIDSSYTPTGQSNDLKT